MDLQGTDNNAVVLRDKAPSSLASRPQSCRVGDANKSKHSTLPLEVTNRPKQYNTRNYGSAKPNGIGFMYQTDKNCDEYVRPSPPLSLFHTMENKTKGC